MAVEVVAATRRRFTRAEYYRMVEVGILGPSDRVELIRGEIVQKMPGGRRHRAFVDNLTQLLTARVRDRAIVSIQMPLGLSDDTVPEPDVTVLRRRPVPYKEREADAEDALLLIEVADSSLSYDRTTKLRLYAEVGIREYWLVDCPAEAVEIYRDPGSDGYRDVRRVSGHAVIALQAFPDIELSLADIFA